MESAIEVRNLCRTYGEVVAVDGISFEVAEGEVFGLVGPNGAGKTTTIECVEGLRRPTAGYVRVMGMDPSTERRMLAERIPRWTAATVELPASGLAPGRSCVSW